MLNTLQQHLRNGIFVVVVVRSYGLFVRVLFVCFLALKMVKIVAPICPCPTYVYSS